MIKQNQDKITFLLISKGVGNINYDGDNVSIVSQPVVDVYGSVPFTFNFAFVLGFSIDFSEVQELVFVIEDPKGNLISNYDLKKSLLRRHIDTEPEDLPKLRGVTGRNHNKGLEIVHYGEYSAKVLISYKPEEEYTLDVQEQEEAFDRPKNDFKQIAATSFLVIDEGELDE